LDNLTVLSHSRRIAYFAVFLAVIVVFLGAYTRLSDAGLGCPDWPGCYGHWRVEANAIEPAKAWAEMIHRYAASILGLLILVLGILGLVRRHDIHQPVFIPLLLIALVIFQAALGRWTVTLQLLPVVVMGHLLGGMAILALLWILALKLGHHFEIRNLGEDKKFRFWAILGLIIVFLQISLGGWTSTNYAALVCPDFPYCHGQLFPLHELHKAFNVFMPIGKNFEGGVLDTPSRISIQVIHRLGAVITTVYLLGLGLWVLCAARQKLCKAIMIVIWLALVLQISLGILNVVLMLPISIALMHNIGAAVLLLSIVTLNYVLYANTRHENP